MERNVKVEKLVGDWEHGAMTRREFFERAVLLLGSVTAAEALLAACSPAALPTTTSAPAAAATVTSAPAAAATATRATTPAGQPPTPAPVTPPTTSAIPGFIEPSAVDAADVTYANGSVKMLAHLAKPKTGSGPWPAVIVIHENRGLTDHIKDVTRRVANLGYVALGVDFLSRVGGTDKFAAPANPTTAINALMQDDINADIVASVAYLKGQAFVKPKFGIMGFCWGGGNSLMGAISSPDIVACIIFYGRNPSNIDDVQKLNGPVQANYGELDQGITPMVPALEAAMRKHNKPYDPKIHAGAGHAFFNDTGPAFREAAAKDAWARLVEFYKKNLS